MTDEQYKRLMRRFNFVLYACIVTVALFLIAIALHFMLMPGSAQQSVGPVGPRGEQGESIVGPQGPPGASIVGERGPVGEAGADGATVITEKETVLEKTGEQGPQGNPGPAGREVELQRNAATGDLEWRYVGDELWQLLLEGCELTGVCETDGGSADQ